MNSIIIRIDITPSVEQTINLYKSCSLGERRPVSNPKRFRQMLDNANLIVTAWDNDKLVGIARCLTDFTYVTYLSDLAVDSKYQKNSIGKKLIQKIQQTIEPTCKLVLLSAPSAEKYYPHIGFEKHSSCWTLQKQL